MVFLSSSVRGSGGRFKRSHDQDKIKTDKVKNLTQFRNEKSVNEPGRRLIDVDSFGKNFDSGCEKCGEHILWRNLISEKIYGLCSAMYFKCTKCLHITKLYSSGTTAFQERSSPKKRRPFSVNVKAALAMIHAGIGPTHLNAIFVTLGLPPINPKTLKRRERDIGPILETTAQISCTEYSELERNLTESDIKESGDNDSSLTFEQALEFLEMDHENELQVSFSPMDSVESADQETPLLDKRPLVDVTVSQDAAWSKRGKAMNSLSGVGHVIGLKTRKCLNFSTRKKKCKRCSHYEKYKQPTPKHDCRQNWSHSARSMEADIAVQLHKEAQDADIKYSNVIGDEDSSAIKQIREQVNSDVHKYSDITHIKRSLTKKLLTLSQVHSSLTERVRQSVLKNFTYAVHQNKDKSIEDLQNALKTIVPHMYGQHSSCGTWCGHLTKSSYRHANLPHGKDLTDLQLKKSLQTILEPFIHYPTKLMTSGDSQPNESLNNVIFSKAPKVRNYNLSESFDFRCAAGILQFNNGKSYLETVITESKLSPRKETLDYTVKEGHKRKYLQEYKSRKTHKKDE